MVFLVYFVLNTGYGSLIFFFLIIFFSKETSVTKRLHRLHSGKLISKSEPAQTREELSPKIGMSH